jgi:indole-3-glycerol phosphate synthase
MTIIDTILKKKEQELKLLPNYLSKNIEQNKCSFLRVIQKKEDGRISIIAEIKKTAPSQEKAHHIDVVSHAHIYEKSGVSAISCLTDETFFEGSCDDLRSVASTVNIPVLRKDFIFTKNQIAQSRFYGASSYLLMVEVIEKTETNLIELIECGRSLGMEPLVETYDEKSIKKAVKAGAKIIGVNSRNFQKTNLSIEFERFERLLPLVPDGIIRVAESGIKSTKDIQKLKPIADVVLIGTALMQKSEQSLPTFISSLKRA